MVNTLNEHAFAMQSPSKFGNGTFDQLIDHSNPSKGTFKQRYWWSTEWYAGDNSPIVLVTPGEVAAELYTGYLTNKTLPGRFSQESGGANILLEHRYYGTSFPVDNLETENMQYHTLDNAVQDLIFFAETVKLPFGHNTTNAPHAPWVLSGGSYAGALTAWVEALSPDTFWGYHASSAVVEAVEDFWMYYHGAELGGAKNCTSDTKKVVAHVTDVLEHGSHKDKKDLKKLFGLESLEYDNDVASVLSYGPGGWQEQDFDSQGGPFMDFCDYIEGAVNSTSKLPGAEGVGLKKALNNYATYVKEAVLPGSKQISLVKRFYFLSGDNLKLTLYLTE